MATAIRIVPYTAAWNVGDEEIEPTSGTAIDFEPEEVFNDTVKSLDKTIVKQDSQKQESFYYDKDKLGASGTIIDIVRFNVFEYFASTYAKMLSLFNEDYLTFDLYLNYLEDTVTKNQYILSRNRRKVYKYGEEGAFINHFLTFYRSE